MKKPIVLIAAIVAIVAAAAIAGTTLGRRRAM